MKLVYSLSVLFLLNVTYWAVGSSAALHVLSIDNFCPFPIWPGILNNYDDKLLEKGGFMLNESASHSFYAPTHWSGKIWARTNCDETGHCQSGDCGGKIECGGKGPTGPVTVAHFGFDGIHDKDYYEVSLDNGYNLPIQVKPFGNFKRTTHDYYDCTPAGCKNDLNEYCPSELAVLNSTNQVVACKSPCQAFNTDMFCCRGYYAEPERCKTADWPASYSVFKNSCPDAKNNVFDSSTRTFWCSRDKDTIDYDVIFCPK